MDVLSNEKKLFTRYISWPQGDKLQHIIDRFQFICGLRNVVGTIDGSHIPLAQKSTRRDTSMPADIYCARKGFNSVVLQAVCDANKLFWRICCNMPGGTSDGGAFQLSSLYVILRACQTVKDLVVHIQGLDVHPYLFVDSG